MHCTKESEKDLAEDIQRTMWMQNAGKIWKVDLLKVNKFSKVKKKNLGR
jgi:hypothetical protein